MRFLTSLAGFSLGKLDWNFPPDAVEILATVAALWSCGVGDITLNVTISHLTKFQSKIALKKGAYVFS